MDNKEAGDVIMLDSPWLAVLAFFGGLLAIVGFVAFLLHLRDRIAKSQGKTQEQVQSRFLATLQFWSALERCIPGVLVIVFGGFYVYDRSHAHESDWWIGLLFIPAGWILVLLLARKRWRLYLELRRLTEKGESEYEYVSTEPPTTGGE